MFFYIPKINRCVNTLDLRAILMFFEDTPQVRLRVRDALHISRVFCVECNYRVTGLDAAIVHIREHIAYLEYLRGVGEGGD